MLSRRGGATSDQGVGQIGAGGHRLRLESFIGPGEGNFSDPQQIFLRGQRLDDCDPVTPGKNDQGALEEVLADAKQRTFGSHDLDPIGQQGIWFGDARDGRSGGGRQGCCGQDGGHNPGQHAKCHADQ